jgi:transketolase
LLAGGRCEPRLARWPAIWVSNKLIVLYDDNKITIDGDTDVSFTEDVQKRFEAYGFHWIVKKIHIHCIITYVPQLVAASTMRCDDLEAIDAAIRAAKADTKHPSIRTLTVQCRCISRFVSSFRFFLSVSTIGH